MRITHLHICFILLVFAGCIFSGCSGRKNQKIITDDHTTLVLPQNNEGVSVQITLGRKIGKMSGKPIFSGTVFPIGKEERVFAYTKIQNLQPLKNTPHIFHIEWLNTNDRVIFRKKFVLPDTATSFMSSVSSADRETGGYKVRIFHFRVLIAEKDFRLIDDSLYTDFLRRHIGAKLSFCRKVDKRTGERIGADTVFQCGPKKWCTAVADFRNKPAFADEMKFRMEWVGPADTVVFRKILNVSSGDTTGYLKNSMSLKPEKRTPGTYTVNLYFFNYLIARESFTLVPEEKTPGQDDRRANIGPVGIEFFLKSAGPTAETQENNPVFSLAAGEKLFVKADLGQTKIQAGDEITIQWVNPERKVFFKKTIALTSAESLTDIRSSIAIDPDKRTPGQYAVRIMYQKKVAAEKRFRLRAD